MPIKGLSDQTRLPRLGKIHLGRTSAGGYPERTPYFVVPDAVASVVGPEPTRLLIAFPAEDPEQVASQYYRCYARGRGLICKGDGERAVALVDLETGEIANPASRQTERRDVGCDPITCAHYQAKRCRQVMCLQFLLPHVPGLGVWQIDTSSTNSILNINAALRLLTACGRMSYIPLELSLQPQEAQVDGKKQTIYVLHLNAHLTLFELSKIAQTGSTDICLLPSPDDDPPEDTGPAESTETPVDEDVPGDLDPPAGEVPVSRVVITATPGTAGDLFREASELGYRSPEQIQTALGMSLGAWRKAGRTYPEALALLETKAAELRREETDSGQQGLPL